MPAIVSPNSRVCVFAFFVNFYYDAAYQNAVVRRGNYDYEIFFYGCVRFSLKHLQCENISQTVFAACCWSWCGSHSQIKMMRNLDTGSKGIKILTSDYVNINGSASRFVVRLSTWSINNTNSWMANENEIDLFLDAVISNQTRKITKTPGSIKFFFSHDGRLIRNITSFTYISMLKFNSLR